ncbi:hypothetical protein GCM10011519_02320 [Marmoricola endophyticus]|uniref:DUF4192 domain-containing protein n=1 Tax=Marmoricola endophyticus TaxID=2040280 RepID=A0A917B9E6_9ACTN|nr:DUF4192 domain-containing protein [Marmoricola endophyticus]GGF32449.1 hypothetical protein GCM10011519_02320 [Marmoricola endophyticus]
MSTHVPSSGPPSDAGESRFTVRSTDDVIALVPLVLGFHPSESVVMLTFGAPTGSFHARVDLPRAPDDVEEVAGLLARAVAANGATTVMLVVCSEDHEDAVLVVDAVGPSLGRAGADLVEAVRIDGRRWWSLREDLPVPHPYDVSTHPFTVQHVLAGEVVRPDRQAVADSLVRTDEEGARRLSYAVQELRAQHRDPRLEAAWLRDWLCDRAEQPRDTPERPVEEDDVARVLALVQADEQREVACLDLTRERARPLCATWTEIVRRAPDGLTAGPSAVLALTAWLAGNGALAWCAIDRVRPGEPGVELARAVARALQQAVPPSSWDPPDPDRCRVLQVDDRAS